MTSGSRGGCPPRGQRGSGSSASPSPGGGRGCPVTRPAAWAGQRRECGPAALLPSNPRALFKTNKQTNKKSRDKKTNRGRCRGALPAARGAARWDGVRCRAGSGRRGSPRLRLAAAAEPSRAPAPGSAARRDVAGAPAGRGSGGSPGERPGDPPRIPAGNMAAAARAPPPLPRVTPRLTRDLVWLLKELGCGGG